MEIADLVEEVRPSTRWAYKASPTGRQIKYRPPHLHISIRLTPNEVEALVKGIGLAKFVRHMGFTAHLQTSTLFVVTLSPEEQSKLGFPTVDGTVDYVLERAIRRYNKVSTQ